MTGTMASMENMLESMATGEDRDPVCIACCTVICPLNSASYRFRVWLRLTRASSSLPMFCSI